MHFRALVALVAFLFMPLTACAAKADYTEGTDYRTLTPALPVDGPRGKVQVMELFWYGCPHCFQMDPDIQKWRETRPAYVDFVRVPAAFSRYQSDGSPNPWYTHAKVFYAAEVLGVGERVHTPLFNAMHIDRRPLRTEEDLVNFFTAQGVPAKEFKAALNSFAVDTKVVQAMDISKRSGITGVPAIIVAGKYQVLGTRATSHEDYLKIVDYLIAKERERH